MTHLLAIGLMVLLALSVGGVCCVIVQTVFWVRGFFGPKIEPDAVSELARLCKEGEGATERMMARMTPAERVELERIRSNNRILREHGLPGRRK